MGVGSVMSGEGKYLTGNPGKKRLFLTAFILVLVLTPLGYLVLFRPVIAIAPGPPGIYIKNKGRMDALIHKVDVFWYWAGEVAFLSDMPPMRQKVVPGEVAVRLQIPNLPGLEEKTGPKGPWYMKLAVRYCIPGIPIFRFTTFLYFEFDQKHRKWTPITSIPPRYRALGKVGMGDVGKIELGLD